MGRPGSMVTVMLPRDRDYASPPETFARLYRSAFLADALRAINDPKGVAWERRFLGTCSPITLKVYTGAIQFELDPRPLTECLHMTRALIEQAIAEIRDQFNADAVADFIRDRSSGSTSPRSMG